jgi:transposase
LQKTSLEAGILLNDLNTTVALDWSNGSVEGQIDLLKTPKRQICGRAGLDLLGPRSVVGRDHQN